MLGMGNSRSGVPGSFFFISAIIAMVPFGFEIDLRSLLFLPDAATAMCKYVAPRVGCKPLPRKSTAGARSAQNCGEKAIADWHASARSHAFIAMRLPRIGSSCPVLASNYFRSQDGGVIGGLLCQNSTHTCPCIFLNAHFLNIMQPVNARKQAHITCNCTYIISRQQSINM